MGIAFPIISTAAAWPVLAAARIGLALLIGLYCGVTKSDAAAMIKLADTSSVRIALFLTSAVWTAWAIMNLAGLGR
jgi:hypothetical protein